VVFSIGTLQAQSLGEVGHDHHPGEPCISHHVLHEQLQDANAQAQYEAYQEALMRYAHDPQTPSYRENGKRIIPVVFHILQKGGGENISKEKIYQQIKTLNDDFQRLNADTVNTPARFKPRITEETWFTFQSNAALDYLYNQRYILVGDADGNNYAFYFRTNDTAIVPTISQAQSIPVQISLTSNAQAIAGAFSSAVNARAEFNTVMDSDAGSPRVKVTCVTPGNTFNGESFSIEAVRDSLHRQGLVIAGNPNIEFRLATLDPQGNCTDGIVRVFTDNTVNVRDNTGFKALSYWNAYSYLNVWVVQSIQNFGAGGTTLGYAQFPATGFLSTDGITVISSNIGLPNQGGRTSTHEVGHWLGLIHIWGDDDCGSDQVADTPTAQAPNFNICGNVGQPLHTEPYKLGVCDPLNPDGEMFSNYMDYSSDFCMNQFTVGQSQRMDFTLSGTNDSPGIRSYLVSQQNLLATGTADPYNYEDVTCVPKSLFHLQQGGSSALYTMICEGEDVRFRANAYNADVDDFSWQFAGGTPDVATQPNPTIVYNTPGTYDVTLGVSNGVGSNSLTMPGMVIVSSNTAEFQSDWGYVETFWLADNFINHYHVFNHDGSENKWEYYQGPNGGSNDYGSVRMVNFDNVVGRIDEFVSPSYNLSTVSNVNLKFRWSGASINSTPDDQLKIYVSTDCGETWGAARKTYTKFQLVNSGLEALSYVPNAASVWTDEEVSLGNTASNSANVRIKFEWLSSGQGNNFYIDDITLTGTPLSAESLESEIGLNIAPNPTSESTSITMTLSDNSKVEMVMLDVMGRKVVDLHAGQMGHGSHRFDVNMSAQAPGIYFLRVAVNNSVLVKKVVKN